MPTIKYSNNPNEETAFVTTEDDTRTRVVLTTPVDGTVKFPDNPNSTKVSVTVDGVARKAVAVYNLGGGGGGDQHNLGWYATETALTTAHPTATAGDFAIVGSTDTVWVWDTDNEEWVDSDQKGQVTSVNGQTGAVTVDTLPDQTGQSGKFLTTDGTDASWSDKPLVNTATGTGSVGLIGTTNNSNSVVIGKSAQVNWNGGIAIGYGSKAQGIAIGINAKSNSVYGNSIAIGVEVETKNQQSIAIGGNSSDNSNKKGIAIGYFCKTDAVGAIQIGWGTNSTNYATNSDANTVKISNANGNYEMMSADGTIPTARLTKVNTTITLAAADWSSNTQTVTVNGVTSTSVVFVAPDPADTTDYVSAGILCASQGTNSLTFTATTTPSADIDVVVVAM